MVFRKKIRNNDGKVVVLPRYTKADLYLNANHGFRHKLASRTTKDGTVILRKTGNQLGDHLGCRYTEEQLRDFLDGNGKISING